MMVDSVCPVIRPSELISNSTSADASNNTCFKGAQLTIAAQLWLGGIV
jgi:hypothetical protein